MRENTPRRSDAPPLRAAALTLLLAAVLVCLALLGVLCLTTARADLRLAQEQLDGVADQGAQEIAGAQWLAEAEAALQNGTALPEGTVRQGDTLTAELELGDGATLCVTARAEDGALTVERWQVSRDWQPEESLNVWGGISGSIN